VALDPTRINNATVTQADILADNGVIHAIDMVLLPNTIADIVTGDPDFSILSGLLSRSGITRTLARPGPFTVFAPTNEAFGKVPQRMLNRLLDDPDALSEVLYNHLTPGAIPSSDLVDGSLLPTSQGYSVSVSLNPTRINNANVTQADIIADNGIIHAINELLIPRTIADVAAEDPNFSTLSNLLARSGLSDTLAGPGPFTVFAPTNDAFAKIPADRLNFLLSNPDALYELLLYHVTPGSIFSSDLLDGSVVPTVQGSSVSISLNPARINDANIITGDVVTDNGIIHAIDTVLVPPFSEESFPSGGGGQGGGDNLGGGGQRPSKSSSKAGGMMSRGGRGGRGGRNRGQHSTLAPPTRQR
jgi:transforming growth factor-beta-induced protein